MVLSTLPDLEAENKVVNSAALYEHYTNRWTVRDEWRARMPLNARHSFCDALAWSMYAKKMKDISFGQLRHLADNVMRDLAASQAELDDYANDIQTCSFLVRVGEGDRYQFAHKSFIEYFVARQLARSLSEGLQIQEDVELSEDTGSEPVSVDDPMQFRHIQLHAAWDKMEIDFVTARKVLNQRLYSINARAVHTLYWDEDLSSASLHAQLKRHVTQLFDLPEASSSSRRLPFETTPEIATFALEWLQMHSVALDDLVKKVSSPDELLVLTNILRQGNAGAYLETNIDEALRLVRESDDLQFCSAVAGALAETSYIRSADELKAMQTHLGSRGFAYLAYVIAEKGAPQLVSALKELDGEDALDAFSSIVAVFAQRESLPAATYQLIMMQKIHTFAECGDNPELALTLVDFVQPQDDDLITIVGSVLASNISEKAKLDAVALLERLSAPGVERKIRSLWFKVDNDRVRRALQKIEERIRSTAAQARDRDMWSSRRDYAAQSRLWRSLAT